MPEIVFNIISFWLCVINVSAFVLTLSDKRRAEKHRWRIRESALIAVAFLGGGTGELLGMLAVRHKIRNLKFIISVPLFILLWAAGLYISGYFAYLLKGMIR